MKINTEFKYILNMLCLITTKALSQETPKIEWSTEQIFPVKYNPECAPERDGKPVIVQVYISVLSLIPAQNDLSFSVDMLYNQYWNDYRLLRPEGSDKDKLRLSSRFKDRLWKPDTYFQNAIKGRVSNIMSPEVFFTITNQTNVFMSTRIQMDMSCDMDFKRYPFDSQKCYIRISTLMDTSDTVQLQWKQFKFIRKPKLQKFQINTQIYTDTDECAKSNDAETEELYSCLIATIHLNRKIGSFIVKRYIPSILILVMTFVGFWIPTHAHPARISLIITSLLAMITAQIQEIELGVSYINALQVWNITCIIFIFGSLIEYAIAVSYLSDSGSLDSPEDGKNESDPKALKWFFWIKVKDGQRNTRIDMYARILFPGAFIVFMCIYFILYLPIL